MKPVITIDRALSDPNLLGAGLGDVESWATWLAVLRAAFALPLSPSDRERFAMVAGDREAPSERVGELWCVLGRRSGKTRIAAAISVYIAALEQHRLARGEVGFVLLLAASKSQASVALGYVLGFLEASVILRQQIENVTADEIKLRGDIVIGVHANSYRTIRGRTLLAVVGDETAFWRDESSTQPDVETYRACIPALAAAHGLWVGISTGYRKMGLLYTKHRDHYGQNSDDVLVVQGRTEQFNTTIASDVVAKARAADPEAAGSEWEGGFRDDIAAFLGDDAIDAATDLSRPLEIPRRSGVQYRAFCDASGGRHDHFTIAIGHREGERYICDALRGWAPPFDPQVVVAQFATLLKEFGLNTIRGDNYSAAWVAEAWRANGIVYQRSELPKSALYLESLPLFVRRVISMPNVPRLIRELRLLERRTSRSGKDNVDHGRNGSDDYSNSLCGLLQFLVGSSRYGTYDSSMKWVTNGDQPVDWQSWRRSMYVASGGRFR